LRVEDARRRYGSFEAVRGLSFEVHAGEVFGLLGPNGAGKTTTIGLIATQLALSSGDAYVFGHSVTSAIAAVRHIVGVVPQEVALYPELTGRENLRFFGRMYGLAKQVLTPRVDELLEMVGLEARADDRVATYSGGMKRRLNLAAGLVHDPRLVLLDEPTAGVDPQSRARLFAMVRQLRERGIAVVYTTHYMEEAERLCDRVAIMDEGRIIAMGRLDALLREADGAEVITLRGLPAQADIAALHSAPGVVRIDARDGVTRVFVAQAARLLGPLERAVAPYADRVVIEIAPSSLETLFLQLTGKALRD
jgi:ABC-2 type transport system ATP-binding protein